MKKYDYSKYIKQWEEMMNNDYKEDVKVVENPPKQNPTKPTHKPIKIGDTTNCATSYGAISGAVCHPNDFVWYDTHDVDCTATSDGSIVTFCIRCGAIIEVRRSL